MSFHQLPINKSKQRRKKILILPMLDSALSQGPSLKDVQGDHKRDFLSLSSSVHMWVKNQEVSTLRSTCPCVCPSQTAWWPLSLFSNPLPRILFYKSPDCPIPDLLYPLDISLWRQNTKRSYKGETLQNSKIPFGGEESRWRRNRTGRSLSLLQIH